MNLEDYLDQEGFFVGLSRPAGGTWTAKLSKSPPGSNPDALVATGHGDTHEEAITKAGLAYDRALERN